jgi:LuxR family maltose regulon positive regulatory protein
MANLDSVLRHAITPPTFDRTKLHRDRLVDAIHADVPRKLIVIAAPAGYGKTTLLADFTTHTDLPVCWVRLTEADRDVVRFSTVLQASLQKRFRRLRDHLDVERLAGSSPKALARAFADEIDARVSETFVIALDDTHLINRSKDTMAFLDVFIEEQPDQVTVLAAGREVLEVSLAKLMAESDLAGFGPHDLALTRSELIELARRQADAELTSGEADRLLDRTQGWIAGVLLSAELSTDGLISVATSTRPMVYEYLASVVLNQQPDDLRRFMLDSSVFPVMTAEACDYVLQRDDSHRFLGRLMQGGLFVTATDESPRTYEYHPQFREFLLQVQAGMDQKHLHTLMVRTAGFLAELGSPEHAVNLYCDAGASRKAARLAERNAQSLYWSGRWRTLEVWAERLDEVGASSPKVHLYLAQYYSDQGNVDLAEETLKKASGMVNSRSPRYIRAYEKTVQGWILFNKREYDEVLRVVNEAEKLLGKRGSLERRADCYRLRALAYHRGMGDLEIAANIAKEAVDLFERSGSNYGLANALIDLSNIQSDSGDAIEARGAAAKAHEILMQIGAPLMLAISFNNLAYDSHFQGMYEDSLDLYTEALKYARQAASPAREANILYSQADLFSDLDLALQAAELYGQGLTLATQMDDVDLIRYGCLQTSVLHRRRNGGALAHEWLGRAMALDDGKTAPAMVQIQMAALEANARPVQAQKSLKRLLDNKNRLFAEERALALYFLARAYLSSGEVEAAREALESGLDWAGANGVEQVLAGEMAFDSDFKDFARYQIGNHPILSVILRYMETMRAVANHYQDVSHVTDEKTKLIFVALGDALVQQRDGQVADLKPLAREVLFHLVDHQRVERDVLLETFWPHHPPGRQVANLHTAVYSLRRELGKNAILHDGSVYCLNAELPIEYDVNRFERAAAVAEGLPPGDPRRLFALTEAINSYGGVFLPEFSSDWVIERRRALEMRYLELLKNHAEEALVRDQPLRAVNTLRQALKIDPYRDDTNYFFLEALGRLGRRSEVVAHYQRYIRLLADELGLDPPESLRELYARLIS